MSAAQAEPAAAGTPTNPAITLYGAPVSNYSARCRYIIYRKNISEQVAIELPKKLGGLKTEEYLKLNPLGKMPLAVIHRQGTEGTEEAIFESSVICEYLAERFDSAAPSFWPSDLMSRARARTIVNLLDVYLGPLHPYMYKANVVGDRAEGTAKMKPAFDAIEHMLDPHGPYATGSTPSIADACLWGNFPFYDIMLPTFFGWNPTDGRPKLLAWRKAMAAESESARKVYNEVFEGLEAWWEKGRWDDLGMKAVTGRPTSTVL